MNGTPRQTSLALQLLWLLASALMVGGCCLLLYSFIDRDLALAVREFPKPLKTLLNLIDSLGNSAWFLIPGGLGAVLLGHPARSAVALGRVEQLRRWQECSSFIFATVLISGLLAVFFKIICGRPRPELFVRQGQYSFQFLQFSSDLWSFPSGHATTIFAAMTACFFFAPRCRLLWYTVALLVAAGRVVNGSHFPSDVLAGAFLGTATTVLLRDWFHSRRWLEFPDLGRNRSG